MNGLAMEQWALKFNHAKPFRFLVIDNALDNALAESLSENFPTLDTMSVKYKGINEMKSEHSNFALLHPDFSLTRDLLSSAEVISKIEKISNIHDLLCIHDRYGYGLHQGGRNSFLDIHVDYNLHPLEKKQRRLNFILFLNKEWKEEWGGALEFWNKDVTICEQSILPKFNRAVIFECNEYSFHGYSQINCPADITRKSLYHYYFSEPSKKLLFHDTIFRNTPKQNLSKKIIVTFKEAAKNLVKRVLFHLGLNKFLK